MKQFYVCSCLFRAFSLFESSSKALIPYCRAIFRPSSRRLSSPSPFKVNLRSSESSRPGNKREDGDGKQSLNEQFLPQESGVWKRPREFKGDENPLFCEVAFLPRYKLHLRNSYDNQGI